MSDQVLPAIVGGRLVRTAAVIAAAAAVVALIVGASVGQVTLGAALAIGLMLGSLNGLVTARLIRLPMPFMASSMLRLFTLSMVGAALGYALGPPDIWLVILGIGVAQVLLAGSAIRELVAQR